MLASYVRRVGDGFDLINFHNFQTPSIMLAALVTLRPFVITTYYHGGCPAPEDRTSPIPHAPGPCPFQSPTDHLSLAAGATHPRLRLPRVATGVSIIPGGKSIPAEERHGQQERRLLCVGRLVSHKQVERVVQGVAWAAPGTTLTVVGSGPTLEQVETEVRVLGLAGRVRLVGNVNEAELRQFFAESEAFITMSTSESFGLSLLDALGAGLPCVISAIPAHEEVAQYAPGRTVRVPPNVGAPELGAAIDAAFRLPWLLPSGLPTWDESCDATLRVYEAAIHASD